MVVDDRKQTFDPVGDFHETLNPSGLDCLTTSAYIKYREYRHKLGK